MFFCSLFSSSSGNSFLIKLREKVYLIDIGKPPARISKSLEKFEIKYENVSGIIVTHLHQDHFHLSNVKELLKTNTKLYLHSSHIPYLLSKRKNFKKIIDLDKVVLFENCKKIYLSDDFFMYPIAVPHDTVLQGLTFGFLMYIKINEKKWKKISFFSDLGFMPVKYLRYICNSHILALEHNYEPYMLWNSNRTEELKRRISSDYGHLSNYNANQIVNYVIKNSQILPQTLFLIHLSQECNKPQLPYNLTYKTLTKFNLQQKIDIKIAKPEEISEVIYMQKKEVRNYEN